MTLWSHWPIKAQCPVHANGMRQGTIGRNAGAVEAVCYTAWSRAASSRRPRPTPQLRQDPAMLTKVKPAVQLKDMSLFRQQCYINGEWVDADDKATMAVYNPADGQQI